MMLERAMQTIKEVVKKWMWSQSLHMSLVCGSSKKISCNLHNIMRSSGTILKVIDQTCHN